MATALRIDPLDDLRITGAVLLHETYDRDWAIAVPDEAVLRRLLGVSSDMRVMPFHLVRRGGFDLIVAGADRMRLNEHELSLVPGGCAHRLQVGDPATSVPLEVLIAGQIAGEPMTTRGATECICGAFVVRSAPLNPLLGALPAVLKVTATGAGASPALNGVVDLLAAELVRGKRDGFTARRLLELMAGEAIRACQRDQAARAVGWFRGLTEAPIADAIRRIHSAPGKPWSVQQLAAGACLSPSRFAARFRLAVGESVMAYVARWRANVACRMLREGDLPVAEIAAQVGYESLAAFSRAFKAQVGVPPAHWRRSAPA